MCTLNISFSSLLDWFAFRPVTWWVMRSLSFVASDLFWYWYTRDESSIRTSIGAVGEHSSMKYHIAAHHTDFQAYSAVAMSFLQRIFPWLIETGSPRSFVYKLLSGVLPIPSSGTCSTGHDSHWGSSHEIVYSRMSHLSGFRCSSSSGYEILDTGSRAIRVRLKIRILLLSYFPFMSPSKFAFSYTYIFKHSALPQTWPFQSFLRIFVQTGGFEAENTPYTCHYDDDYSAVSLEALFCLIANDNIRIISTANEITGQP